MKEKISVDLIGRIGEEGGIGNYSTKLYYALEESEGLEVNPIDYGLSSPFLESTLQNFFETPLILFRSNADLIHFTSQEQVSGLFWMPKKYLKNVVVTVHDISPYVNNYAGPVSQLVSWFYTKSLKKTGRIVAISEFTKDELVEHLDISEEKIDVVYQGIDTDYFYPRKDNLEVLQKYGIEKPYLVYVGSEINRKNMKGNLEKFKELKSDNPQLKLVKVGNAGRKQYRQKTLEFMEELGLEEDKDVVFTGFVDEEDLPRLYSMAEANLLYSHYEGFGRSALEAEACRTPTLTHKKPPMKDYLPKDRWSNQTLDSKREETAIPEWKEAAEKIKEVYRSAT